MKYLTIIVLLIACLLVGCGGKLPETSPTEPIQAEMEATTDQTAGPAETIPAEATEPAETMPAQPEDPLQQLMDSMTLEEKVGQLFLARCPEVDAAEDIAQYQLGGYILFGRDFAYLTPEEVLQKVDAYQAQAKIPLLIGVDEEGGLVVRVSSHFILREEPFQSPLKLYEQGGIERILEDTKEKDALLMSLGVNVNFAPVADVSTDPDDFIYGRTIGQDAQTTAAYTEQVVAQMAQDNMGSCLKHFPGYGSNVDTHTGIAVDERPMDRFLEEDLLPFQSYKAGDGKCAIMVSHNIVTCMDPELPASLSPKVHQFMRDGFGYEGVILTDALDMGAVQEYTDGGDIAVTALLAGNDILLVCDYKTGIPAILEAVEQGTVTEEIIDTACRRVLNWKQSLGLI